MNKFRLTVCVLAIATFAFGSVAYGQASRTWVSGVGDDANPCSRTAPCKTFAGAISKTAAKGEINALDSGGFGAVTITKAITIDGGGNIAGVLASLVNGIIVNAGTGDVVTLRNLDINGFGNGLTGIRILAARTVHIENTQIYGFTGNAIDDNRTATQSPAAQLFVDNVSIRACNGGIAVIGTGSGTRAFINSSRIHDNATFGVAARNPNFASVTNSDISGNRGEGVKVELNAEVVVRSCTLNANATGALNNGGGALSLADTTIMNNATGVSGTIATFGNNNVRNNAGGNALPLPVGQQ
jgi:hypothetical protein